MRPTVGVRAIIGDSANELVQSLARVIMEEYPVRSIGWLYYTTHLRSVQLVTMFLTVSECHALHSLSN